MGGLSLTHMLILAIILLLFFGPNKLSDVAKSIGKGVRGFKEGLNEIEVEAKDIQHNVEHKKPTQGNIAQNNQDKSQAFSQQQQPLNQQQTVASRDKTEKI